MTAVLDLTSRRLSTDLVIGDRARVAMEIGPAHPLAPRLRTCTLWLDGAIATPHDNTV